MDCHRDWYMSGLRTAVFLLAVAPLLGVLDVMSAGHSPEPQRRPRKGETPSKTMAQFRAVLINARLAGTEQLAEFKAQGFNAVVLEIAYLSEKEGNKNAAENIKTAGLDLYYWIEVARNKAMADAHPEWLCSVQGHKDWRRLFKTNTNPQEGEVVKVYPWVPILYKETFAAHLKRIEELLNDTPEATGLFLNDLQGGPSACGCGSTFCRWTSDYGTLLTATPYSDEKDEELDNKWPSVVSAAAEFVQAVKRLSPTSDVIPVWLTECEEHDRQKLCGNVGCYQGYCWLFYERQLDLLVPQIDHLGVLATFKAFDRDLPVYGEKAGWVKWVLESYAALPRGYRWRKNPETKKERKEVIEARRLVAVLQGWGVTEEETKAQIQRTEEAGAAGYVLSLIEIDQSWAPKIYRVE